MSSTTARGYGADHQAERQRWAAIIAVQDVQCTMPEAGYPCHMPSRTIPAGSPPEAWDLNHKNDRTNGWTGPAHRYCNRWAGTHEPTPQEPASRSW